MLRRQKLMLKRFNKLLTVFTRVPIVLEGCLAAVLELWTTMHMQDVNIHLNRGGWLGGASYCTLPSFLPRLGLAGSRELVCRNFWGSLAIGEDFLMRAMRVHHLSPSRPFSHGPNPHSNPPTRMAQLNLNKFRR